MGGLKKWRKIPKKGREKTDDRALKAHACKEIIISTMVSSAKNHNSRNKYVFRTYIRSKVPIFTDGFY